MAVGTVPGSAFSAYAEDTPELSVDPTGQGDGYSAVLYDSTNGLPTSEANAIVQTEEGFIWIGGYSGLIRYDGDSFQRIASTTGIVSVVSLFVDSQNRLWIGTNDSGAAVMENGTFRIYNKEDGLASLSIRSITEDAQGDIYLATTQGMAVVDTHMELHPIDEPKINEEYIRMLKTAGDGTIYGVTMNGAVFTMHDEVLTGYYDAEMLGISGTHAILPDNSHPGYVYIGNKGSELYYGELGNGFRIAETIRVKPLNYINSISAVGDMIWVQSDSGIGFLHEDKFVSIINVPMNTSVENMLTDYQGNLWFASSKQGVMKIVPNQFTDIFKKYHLPNEVVESTCMYNGTLLIGTKNSGVIAVQDGSRVRSIPLNSSKGPSGQIYEDTDLLEMLRGQRTRCMLKDSQGRLWFATFGEKGLVCFDHGNATSYRMDDGMPSDRIRAVTECSDGRILAACTGGLVVIENGAVSRIYTEADGIENTEILTVAQAADGDLVLGTDGGGIYILGDSGLTHLGTDEGLSSDVVMRIKADTKRDLLWIVTSNSIGYMTADHTVTTVRNFPYANNFDLYENSKGELWVMSSNGIYVADAEELLANGEINPVFYGQDNGLPCITTSNSYSALTEDGDLYIAGSSGVAKVNIEQPFETVNDIKMAVPYVEADGIEYYPDKDGQFVIPAGVRKLTIYGFVYSYSLLNPLVTYKLEGFEQNTTTVRRSELTPIHYTNLRGGEYRFHMEIHDAQSEGINSIDVTIIKTKAIHEQLWFRLLCVLAAAGLIALCVKLYIDRRTAAFKKKENEQKQLIREIVEAFAKVIDMKDKYTNGHSTRVAEYTAMLTRELGYDDETVEQYYNIALLHDIGKVGVPPEVLNKPGKLTDTEFNIIKSHSALGYETLKNISIMPELAIGAGAHHERPDGRGYPKGLKGDEIPRVAQIIAVADTFDAMYSDRPYRKRMNFEKAVSIMKEVRGTQLTADVVDAFLRLVEKGEFRAPDDTGGGTTEDIDNIHRKFNTEDGKS